MQVENNFKFFSDATAPGESNALANFGGDTLTVDVQGDGSFELQIFGQCDIKSDYKPLAAIALEILRVRKVITENGLYAFDVSGMSNVKAKLINVSGKVNVFGKLTNA